jgi:hypothetical protein
MKGIYLSDEGKKIIEDRVAELEQDSQFWLNRSIQNIGNPEYNSFSDSICHAKADQAAHLLRDILFSATILPVEKSWGKIIFNGEDEVEAESNYPNGVIIQPKNKI